MHNMLKCLTVPYCQRVCIAQGCALWPAGSINSGHELQVKARMLQHCWDSCGKLIDFVAHFWPEKRGSLYWCAVITLWNNHDSHCCSLFTLEFLRCRKVDWSLVEDSPADWCVL